MIANPGSPSLNYAYVIPFCIAIYDIKAGPKLYYIITLKQSGAAMCISFIMAYQGENWAQIGTPSDVGQAHLKLV